MSENTDVVAPDNIGAISFVADSKLGVLVPVGEGRDQVFILLVIGFFIFGGLAFLCDGYLSTRNCNESIRPTDLLLGLVRIEPVLHLPLRLRHRPFLRLPCSIPRHISVHRPGRIIVSLE